MATYWLVRLPRLSALLMSLMVDYCLTQTGLAPAKERGVSTAWFLYATSYVTWVFLVRPLSNGIEAVVVVLCLTVIFSHHQNDAYKAAVRLGVLFTLGVFTRITFATFVLPLGASFLWNVYAAERRMVKVVSLAVVGSVAVLATTLALASIDSLYFGTMRLVSASTGTALTLHSIFDTASLDLFSLSFEVLWQLLSFFFFKKKNLQQNYFYSRAISRSRR